MALSMDEQRMLAEIERRLAAEDPGLATRLSSFRRPGPAAGLRTPRGRLIMLACLIAVIAVVSTVVYVLVPFRSQALKSTTNPRSHPTSLVSGGSAGTGSSGAAATSN
jgi:Flp pilus assembly protein TadB